MSSRLTSAAFAALAALAACGTPHAGPPPGADGSPGQPDGGAAALSCTPAGGSRLHRILLDHDGTEETVGTIDTDMGVRCRFAASSDQSLRCLPYLGAPHVSYWSPTFSDAACSQPVTTIDGSAAGPLYVVSQGPASGHACDVRTDVYKVGAEMAPPAQLYVRTSDGQCQSYVPQDGLRVFQVAPLAPARFVAGTETWPGDGRLRMSQIDGADGSRVCGDGGPFRDGELGDLSCNLEWGEDQSLRCLPGALVESGFTGSDCTQPVDYAVVASDPSCAPDTYARELSATCSRSTKVRSIGGALPAPALYQDAGGQCVELSLPDGSEAHEVGAHVDVTTFAELQREWVPAGGRLDRGDLVEGDLRVFRGLWRDHTLGTICSFRTASDGATRCLPSISSETPQAGALHFYSDAACTDAMVVGRYDTCTTGQPSYVVDQADGSVWQAGPMVGTPLYRSAGNGCEPVDQETGAVYYQTGALVDPAGLVEATQRVE